MSGLFATLAAAAHGDAEALRARPRGRFEPERGVPSDIVVEERSSSEEPDEVKPHLPPPRARQGRRAGRDDEMAPRREPLMPRAPVAADTDASKADASERPDLGPQDSDQPRGRTSRAEPSARTGSAPTPTAPFLRRTDGVGEAEPLHSSRDGESTFAPARHASEDRAPAPLLPLIADPRAEPDAANPSFAPDTPAPAAPRSRQMRSLSIGRIEVRPPPPAPPPPIPQASYRATTIPRAQPRQSLDEYRRRGR